jgi:hypothetical protein
MAVSRSTILRSKKTWSWSQRYAMTSVFYDSAGARLLQETVLTPVLLHNGHDGNGSFMPKSSN